MELKYRKFKDQSDIYEYRKIRGNTTELIEFENKLQRNLDVPDNLAYYDMGIEGRRNEFLDVTEEGKSRIKRKHRLGFKYDSPCGAGCMDDRHFREHCTIYGDNLYFIHQKLPADMQPMLQLRPEWIQQKMECYFIDACTLSATWRKLGYDKWAINKIMFGYVSDNGEKKNGLQYSGPAKSREYAEYFEWLAGELAEPDVNIEEELRGHYLDVSQRMIDSGEWYAQYQEEQPHPIQQMRWIDCNTVDAISIIGDPEDEVDTMEGYVGYLGEEEVTIRTADTFGINKLFDGNDCIDHELIVEIKEANALKLKKIQQRFFKQKTYYGWKNPEYWWMTDSQRERGWKFINARKSDLAKPSHLSDYTKKVIEQIKHESINDKIKKAMIASFCAGNTFNLYGEIITWDHKPKPDETYAIWMNFNT